MSLISEIISHIHFIRPMVLWFLPIVLFIIWQLQRKASRDDGWSKICDPHLLDAIKINKGSKGSKWTLLLWPISIVAILALAGPAFRKLPTPVIKNQSALIIVLDVSRSMLADDVKPNRLERAKFKINDILAQRKDGQTALIVYAGDAFVVTPLTDDTETIALMLKAISPDIMPVQGSRVDLALSKSQNLFKQAGYISGDIIVISDGVNLSKAQSIAEELVANYITTSVLAIGTKYGAPIPTKSGFVKDRLGNIVVPKLQISALKQLANSGNGRFAQMSGDSTDIDYIVPKVVNDNNENQSNNKEEAFDTEKYIDEGPWLTLLLLPLIALLFRKGLLLSFVLVVGLQTPESSYAFEWSDMWLNGDQKAAKQIQGGQMQEAFDTALSADWKATAAYKKKDYVQSNDLFNDGSADGFYNQGNSLAHSGKLEDALSAYESSLKIRPEDEDTLYNKKQVEEALKQQQQDQQNKDDKNKDQGDQDEKNKQEQKQGQDNKDEQDGEGEKQDGEQKEDQGDNPEEQEQQDQKEQSEMTDEEKKKQEQEQKKLEQADKEAEEKKAEEQQEIKLTPEELAENAENKEAIEQWLRRIPDDPGGLLRRKFYYQYNQQNNKPDEQENW